MLKSTRWFAYYYYFAAPIRLPLVALK